MSRRNWEAIMNKNDYSGLKEVFAFSFLQDLKSSAYITSLVIFALLFCVGIPILGLFGRNSSDMPKLCEIEKISIVNETGFDFDVENMPKGERYKDVCICQAESSSFESIKEELKSNPKSKDVLIRITYDENIGFTVTFVKSASSEFSSDDYEKMTNDFLDDFSEAKITIVDVSKEQLDFVNSPVNYQVESTLIDDDGKVVISPEEHGEGISMTEYGILLGGIIFVMMIVNLAGGRIANQIVTEKSTRVIEYLMINVRPMALILGKILSSLVLVVIEFAVMIISFCIGSFISSALFGNVGSTQDYSVISFVRNLSELSLGKSMVCILIILLGVMFFSILAGLAGASVSKLEELAEGMKLYQMVLMVGTYIGIGMCIAQMIGNVDDKIISSLCLIPITAPFVLPGNIILGNVGTGVGVLAIIILAAITLALYIFTSKVYEAMIFYNGKVLKLKDIINIAKNKNV